MPLILAPPWTSPSRLRAMAKAITDKIGGLTDWTAKDTTDVNLLTDVVAAETSWPNGKNKLAVLVKGTRVPVVKDLQGTTQREYACEMTLVIIVREDSLDSRWDKLDAAEVEIFNALNELQRDTSFGALAREFALKRQIPVPVARQGASSPYASSALLLEASIYE